MTWRYTEYAGCPYLTDWADKKFKFGIILDEDTIIGQPLTVRSVQDLAEFVNLPTNGILRPRFYMRIGSNSSSVFNIEFDRNRGLVRKITSFVPGTVEVEGLSGEFTEFKEQKIGVGGFEDFKRIGEYTVRRFPFIASDLSQSPYGSNADIPDNERDEIEACYEKVLGFPNLEQLQRDLSHDFWNLFTVYTMFEVGNDGIVGRRQNPFTQEQIQELIKLIEPLRN